MNPSEIAQPLRPEELLKELPPVTAGDLDSVRIRAFGNLSHDKQNLIEAKIISNLGVNFKLEGDRPPFIQNLSKCCGATLNWGKPKEGDSIIVALFQKESHCEQCLRVYEASEHVEPIFYELFSKGTFLDHADAIERHLSYFLAANFSFNDYELILVTSAFMNIMKYCIQWAAASKEQVGNSAWWELGYESLFSSQC